MVSLGVGTFNLRQQLAIQDELEVRRRDDPRIEPFFDRGVDEPFFVKNLENIQGDERDVIFLSVTYARGTDGQLRYNFGPLNGENGWRRLNVLTTRARRRMRVFSSMRGDEINPAATTSRWATAATGVPAVRRAWSPREQRSLDDSATRNRRSNARSSPSSRGEASRRSRRSASPVIASTSACWTMRCPGRFVCGIECDGVAYHSSETARDRDRLRQQVLEARGWTLASCVEHRLVQGSRWSDRSPAQRDRCRAGAARAREGGGRGGPDCSRRTVPMTRRRVRRLNWSGDSGEQAITPGQPGPQRSTRANTDDRRRSPTSVTPGEGRFAGTDILQADESRLSNAIQTVVDLEAPIHVAELMTRVAGMWGNRAGSRIQARIHDVASRLVSKRTLRRRGDFFWGTSDECPVRSRAQIEDSGRPSRAGGI